MSLQDSKIATRLPTTDLERARAWYADKLGLEPVDERPGGLLYRVGGSDFALFASSGRASGDHTQMAFEVADLDATIAELEARGVVFEYDGIVEVEGNYPSKHSSGERAVWVRDSEGNLLGIGQPVR
jgi:catechol 2,3-dioxygenase-like lactoylglutathione lyase family enzyme